MGVQAVLMNDDRYTATRYTTPNTMQHMATRIISLSSQPILLLFVVAIGYSSSSVGLFTLMVKCST